MSNLVNYLKIHFYWSQQYINNTIVNELHNFTLFVIMAVFAGGLFTSMNPCNISTLVIVTGYVNKTKKYNIKKHSLILGIISSFLIILLLILLWNIYYIKISHIFPMISSFYMITIGLNLLEIIPLNYIIPDWNHIDKKQFHYIIKDYITGLILGISSSSCSASILVGIMFWISKSQSIFIGLAYIICYMIGYILPLYILIDLSIKKSILINLNTIWQNVIPLSGSLMLSYGIFSLLSTIFT